MAQQPVAADVERAGPEQGLPRIAARTYREVFANTVGDAIDQRPAEYLLGFRFVDGGAGGVPTPAALRDLTIQLCDRRAMAFLCLVQGPEGRSEVRILHRFMRYSEMPGEDPTGYHDHVFGLLGDVRPHQYPVVEVPGTTFHLIGQATRVPTIAAMPVLMAGWADPGFVLLGPYNEQDPDTELVRPRHVQLLPNRYAALVVHRHRLTPKDAYLELAGAIAADDATEACSDVLAWLRAACTARGGGGAQNLSSGVYHPFNPVHLPEAVYNYVAFKIHQDLPAQAAGAGGRDGAGDAAQAVTAQIAAALQTLTATRGGGGATESREPKTVVEAYKETYTVLLRFCNVTTAEEVAPVWRRLANAHKSELATILTQEFNRVCMARGLSTDPYSPAVTTQLKQMITGLQFVGMGADDLSTGCQPFLVSYSGGDHHRQVLAAASLGHQLSQGEQNPSLADYRSLRETEKLRHPRDTYEVSITLQRFAVLAQCLFQGTGASHPLVTSLWTLAASFQNQVTHIAERTRSVIQQSPGVAASFHARILRHVQLRVHDYLQAVSVSVGDTCEGVEVPSFQDVLLDLKYGTFHHSSRWAPIPEAYMESPPASHGSTASVPGRSRTSEGSSTPTSRSGVSSITAATPTPATSVTRVDNPTDDADFTGPTLRSGIGSILRATPPPLNDAGHEFCVSWWCKKGCYPTCGRRATHVPFASPSERSRLLEFVRSHVIAPAAPSTTRT